MRTAPRSPAPLRPLLTVLAVVTTLTAGVLLQDRADGQEKKEVTITSESLGGGLYMLRGQGGNLGLSIGGDGVFLIDSQFAPLTAKIQKKIEELGGGPVRFVLNTHCHGDHIGGNENLGSAGAVIVAQDNVRKRMSVDQFNAAFNDTVKASPAKALPIVTFLESLTFHLNGETIEVMHVPPAHTDGDAVVFFQNANVVHMGDCFFNGLYPLIDVSRGGSFRGVIAAVDRVLARTDASTRFIPGHGPMGDRAALVAFRDMLALVAERLDSARREGKTLEEIKAAKPTADLDAKWGNGFLKPDDFVEIAYGALAAK